jgi:hypothetical protein
MASTALPHGGYSGRGPPRWARRSGRSTYVPTTFAMSTASPRFDCVRSFPAARGIVKPPGGAGSSRRWCSARTCCFWTRSGGTSSRLPLDRRAGQRAAPRAPPHGGRVGQPHLRTGTQRAGVADLLDPRRRGRVDTIVGPDTLTKREQVAAIARHRRAHRHRRSDSRASSGLLHPARRFRGRERRLPGRLRVL